MFIHIEKTDPFRSKDKVFSMDIVKIAGSMSDPYASRNFLISMGVI